MTRNIYIVGGDTEYINWMNGTPVSTMEDADLVCFTGGEDVTPSFYGQPQHPYTGCNPLRDRREKVEWNKAVKLGKPIIGICRGSQFTCAMAGGILVQDQTNPSFIHEIETTCGKRIDVSSTHHQSAYPWGLPANSFKVLGWSVGLCGRHEGGKREELIDGVVPGGKECEIVHYPKVKALGIQSHPEMLYGRVIHQPMIDHMRSLLDGLMAGTL